MKQEKLRLRAEMRSWRQQFSQNNASDKSQKEFRCVNLLTSILSDVSGVVGIYSALEEEMNIQALEARLPNTAWAYPRMTSDNHLEFVKDPLQWTEHSWGVSEPVGEALSLKQLDAILVPGVAFDRQGGRLGMGKGFYDRALSEIPGLKIGVGFKQQVLNEALALEDWDVKMDLIVTEDYVLDLHSMRNAV